MIDDLQEDASGQAPFLHLVLGLLSATERVTRLLTRPHRGPRDARAPRPAEADGLVHLLLGIVSVQVRLREALDASPQAPSTRAEPHEPAPPPLEDLLR
ncbi:hypothetical protein LZ198_17775 [Myxococcus sp. K15C18031901]|uniref:hypothetical protein n=1 Tax=Myxococcus dinghuensis TaxID=2906761 RepID=UPI0020A77604|nr:hypothetical protein [Myxococcus dinghuensis]MCP3100722.1 hypothetical protein [Myxococcus dinghuensis]